MTEKKTPRVEINAEQCKGCELCVVECPLDVLFMSDKINRMGYPYAVYVGDRCSGCGICYYACPEAGTISVYKKEVIKGGGKKDE